MRRQQLLITAQIPNTLWNHKVRYRVYKSPQLVRLLSQMCLAIFHRDTPSMILMHQYLSVCIPIFLFICPPFNLQFQRRIQVDPLF